MSPEIIIFFATKLHVIIVVMALVYVSFLHKQKRNQALLLTLFVLPASYIFGRFAGLIFNNPRPFVVDGFTPLVQHIADNGFPSDHTLFTATIASIVFVYNRPVGIFLFIPSILVGISRVLAGVHHYIDVVGSVVIAVITTYVVTILLRQLQK